MNARAKGVFTCRFDRNHFYSDVHLNEHGIQAMKSKAGLIQAAGRGGIQVYWDIKLILMELGKACFLV